jgi:hypothetical protein
LRLVTLVRVLCIRFNNARYSRPNFRIHIQTQRESSKGVSLLIDENTFNSQFFKYENELNAYQRIVGVLIRMNSSSVLYRPLCQFNNITVASTDMN